MRVLAVEATGSVAGVAVVGALSPADNPKVFAEFALDCHKKHAQTLLPLVASMLETLEMKISEMDFIACSAGPGSFTGLRIGAATAKGLAHGAGLAIIPVPTLDALAYQVYGGEGTVVVPIMDARRGQVYGQIFRWAGDRPAAIGPPAAEDIEELLARLDGLGLKAVFTGDGVVPYGDLAIRRGHAVAPLALNRQRAATVGALALGMADQAVHGRDFAPFYLRKTEYKKYVPGTV